MQGFGRKAAAFGIIAAALLNIVGCGSFVTLKDQEDTSAIITLDAGQYSGISVTANSIKPPLDIPETTTVLTSTIDTESDTSTADTAVSETEQSAETTLSTENQTTPVDTESLPVETTATQKPQTTVITTTTKKEEVTEPQITPNTGTNSYAALNYDEVKGVWISYIELCPVLQCKSEEEFKKGIGELYDNCLSMGINTVYVHLRPFGDAIYDSDYYPWSKYCTGTVGDKPDFDPLPIMIDEAHKRKLSFQGWINPMRCYSASDITDVPNNYLTKKWYNDKAGDYIVQVGDYWYLNPAYSQVTDLISNGVGEIAAKYNVDGLHIDDYFYPTTEEWFDKTAYQNSSSQSLSDFRLNNCSNMIKKMYSAIKKSNSTVLFGASTQGNIANNYAYMYADVEKWCKEDGYVDYMAPQIYYGFENTAQPYEKVLAQWQDMMSGTDVKLMAGLCLYKCGAYDQWAGDGAYEWANNSDIVKRQIVSARKCKNYGGIVLYSYKYLFYPPENAAAIEAEIDAFKPLLK